MDPWIINPNDLNEEFRMCTYPGIMPNMYAISNYGNVFNIINHFILSQFINGLYYKSKFKKEDGSWKDFLIHRLVAWEFVPYRRDINLQVNHIDGNKLNNYYENLEWCTNQENCQHAWRTGLATPHNIGIDNDNHILTNEDVHFICKTAEDSNITSYQIAEMLNNKVSPSTIREILRGARWTHISCNYNIPPRNRFGHITRQVLTEDEVRLIRKQYRSGMRPVDIAASMDREISVNTIKSAVHNQTWKHLL